ncbi:MAG: hypothetical protein SV375_12870 [Thermodesulfobacteriota bacterium]|nr:hypothetical protein [Thermodesulfobacteriota bacterium]
MIDIPGGGGKIPITSDYILGAKGNELLLKNYLGDKYHYLIVK